MLSACKKFEGVFSTPLVMLIIGISVHYILPRDNLFLLIIRLLIGIFAFFYVPGYCITRSFFSKDAFFNKNVFYLVIGITYQLLVLFVGYWYYRFVGNINFALWMYSSSVFATLITTAISKETRKFPFQTSNSKLRENLWLITALSVFLIVSLYYQRYALSPHTDGAAYMDLARNLVKHGIYRSNMIYPKNVYSYIEMSTGLISYFYNYLLIAIFFMMGNISFLTAKIMLIFIHLLNVTLIYYITTLLFTKRAAFFASLLSATSPIILAHVGLAGGAEIPSTLFLLATIYTLLSFIYTAPSIYQQRKGILAGILIGIAYYTWTNTGFILLLALVPYFIYSITCLKVASKKVIFTLFLLSFFLLILEIRFLMVLVRMVIGIPLPTLFPFFFFMSLLFTRSRKTYEVLLPYLLALLAFFIIIYSFDLAQYSTPQLHEYLQASMPESALPPVSAAVRTTGLTQYLSLLTNFDAMYRSWNNYWEVLMNFIGSLVIYFSLLSFVRLNKLKESLLLTSFPLLHVLLWCLVVQYPSIQPRQQINVSIFYFMLAASFIDFILEPEKHTGKKILFSIFLSKNLKTSFDLKQLTAILFMATIVLVNIYPSYQKGIDLMQSWDYKSIFGWDQAIDWIKTNTGENDVIMSRSANYFAWYTERRIAWPPLDSNSSLDDLIGSIRTHKAKYFLMDMRAYYLYPNLRGLYLNPGEFLGARICFQSEVDGRKVIIYNVTNIAFGEPIRLEYVLDNNEDLDNWTAHLFYGNASLELDAFEKVQGNYSIRYTQTIRYNTLAIRFLPKTPLDLSNYDFLTLNMKASEGSYVKFLFATDSSNYFVTKIPISADNWTNIKISLKSLSVGNGNPNLNRIALITIYLGDLEVGKTYSIWLDGFIAIKEAFIIKGG
jgi:hypothetical protein